MALFLEIWQFVVAVMSYLTAYITGGIVMAVLFLYERFVNREVSLGFIYWGLVTFLLVSFFMAWRDEHHDLLAIQKKLQSPEFRFNIASIGTGPLNDGVGIHIGGLISNPLGPPSAAIDWKMILEFPDGRIVDGQPVPLTGQDITIPLADTGSRITLPISNYFPHLTLQPIPAGGAVQGWLFGEFRGVTLDELYEKKATLIVEVDDAVAGHRHSVRQVLSNRGIRVFGRDLKSAPPDK